MSTARRIFRNILSLMVARPLSKIVAFFVSVWLVRYLGKSSLGMLATALNFVALFAYVSDFGTQHFVIREVSRDRSTTGAYLANFLSLQILLGLLFFVAMVVLVNFLRGYTVLVKQAVYLAGAGLVVTSMSGPFKAVFNAHEAIHISAFLGVVLALSAAALTAGGIVLRCGVRFFAGVSIVSGLSIAGLGYFLCRERIARPRLGRDMRLWWRMLKMSIPFALLMGATVIYNRIDVQMLYAMRGEVAVGYYSAVTRLIHPLLLPAQSLVVAVYPVLSRKYVRSKEKFQFAAEKILKYAAALGIPMAVGAFLLSDKIVLLLYGAEFRESAAGLRWLCWSLAVSSLTIVFTYCIVVSGRVVMLAGWTALAATANVLLNLLLIPRYSFRGAAAATIACELCLLVALVFYVRGLRLSRLPWQDWGKTLLAALTMSGLVLLFRSASVFIVVPAAVVIYSGVLLLLRFPSKEEREVLKSALRLE